MFDVLFQVAQLCAMHHFLVEMRAWLVCSKCGFELQPTICRLQTATLRTYHFDHEMQLRAHQYLAQHLLIEVARVLCRVLLSMRCAAVQAMKASVSTNHSPQSLQMQNILSSKSRWLDGSCVAVACLHDACGSVANSTNYATNACIIFWSNWFECFVFRVPATQVPSVATHPPLRT